MFLGVHHVGYLVSNLGETVDRYLELYGGEVEARFYNEQAKAQIAFVRCEGIRVELMEPDDRSLLQGSEAQIIHHVGYLVPDIEKAMEELRAKGVKFLDEKPRVGVNGWKIAYFDGGERMGTKQHLSQA
jgi:methylmalonyl-CoA/ethylmalonyl-CoA epimerase